MLKGLKSPLLLVALMVIGQKQAYAYLDPGTGSYFMQILMAALMAGFFGLRMVRGKLKFFWNKLFKKKGKKDRL